MKLPFLHAIEEATSKMKDKAGVRITPWPLLVAGITLIFFCFLFFTATIEAALNIALFLSPLWLAFLLVSSASFVWLVMRRSYFIASQNYIVLEIKPPRTLLRTPLAMETVLAGMHHSPGEGTWYRKYIVGAVRPYWSLEIASLEGQVRFFIWTRANFRRLIEAQVYAQYPGAQVVEAQDYTKSITAIPGEWDIWGCDFEKSKPDPYPIKTYVEYGLDKVQEEPEQIDPLSNLVEFMGSLGKGEYMWIQYIIRVHKGEKFHKLNEEGKIFTWIDDAKGIVEKLRDKTRQPSKDPATGKEIPGFPNPTKQQTDTMAAIERNVSKLAFDVGVRGVYMGMPGKFDPINITGLTGIFKQFASEGWNGFRPAKRFMTEFDDYPWEIGVSHRKTKARKEVVEAFRRRQFYYEPFAFHNYSVMSTEELATIYHIPSRAVESPSLPRIQSQTGEAPVNLPT